MKISIGVLVVFAGLGFISCDDVRAKVSSNAGTETVQKINEDEDSKNTIDVSADAVSIVRKWDLPPDLLEVSGIAYMDEKRFACIQDEEGKIFIFNRETGAIEKQIPFAGVGDYEGIAFVGNTAYVVRADGMLYEVDLALGKAAVKNYQTPLTAKHDVEGLCYDADNNRLLLAIKGKDPDYPGHKTVYAFELSSKQMAKEPVYKLDLGADTAKNKKGKKKQIMPSEIGIHPRTKELFVLDGPGSRLLVLNQNGETKNTFSLGKSFAQPEGITFSPEGNIFISNEGTKQPGNIIQVELNDVNK